MMKKIMSGWNGLRILRLLIGTGAVVQGIVQKEGLITIAGIWILLGAVLNMGCCGSGGCSVPASTRKTSKAIDYEEVDASQ